LDSRHATDSVRIKRRSFLDSLHRRQRNAKLTGCSLLNYYYLAYCSQPAGQRMLYRHLRRHPCRSIVEVGLGTAERTQRLMRVARRFSSAETIRYTGIDLFEARPQPNTGLKLKEAHQRLHVPGFKVQLVPGDPLSALGRMANTLREIDLLVISADQDAESLAKAWYYVPRMLHSQTSVLWERVDTEAQGRGFQVLSRVDVDRLAEASSRTMRRAG
jgi:hypothetical protein